jgi:hypothetical protein
MQRLRHKHVSHLLVFGFIRCTKLVAVSHEMGGQLVRTSEWHRPTNIQQFWVIRPTTFVIISLSAETHSPLVVLPCHGIPIALPEFY